MSRYTSRPSNSIFRFLNLLYLIEKISNLLKFKSLSFIAGFIRVREMSGKFYFFQGQGIVREFYVVSGKNEYFLKCQGNVREFYNFQFVSNDETQKMTWAVFLTFWIQAKSFL